MRAIKKFLENFKPTKGFFGSEWIGMRNFLDLFAGDVDFAAVMAALRRVGYDDFVTAEVGAYNAAPELLLQNVSAALDKMFLL